MLKTAQISITVHVAIFLPILCGFFPLPCRYRYVSEESVAAAPRVPGSEYFGGGAAFCPSVTMPLPTVPLRPFML